jgi:RimJ/RimL family protein N-acetyltransferase
MNIDPQQLIDVNYDRSFLDQSWLWFQDPELRALTNTPEFSREQQIAWYTSLPSKRDYFIRGIRYQSQPIGTFGIKNIIESVEGEYWGYIGEKEYWGLGIGKWMMNRAISYGQDMGIKKLYLKVIPYNSRAIALYTQSGFEKYREDIGLIWMALRI